MLRAELAVDRNGFDLELALQVEPGDCLALAGPSGCGKTTTLRVNRRPADAPRQGRVACGSEVWLDTAERVNVSPERRRCGFVFQDYALFSHQRAWQNVAYGLRHVPRSERRRRAFELLDRLGVAASGRALGRRRSPAASASGLPWPAPWPPSRSRCCSTSRSSALDARTRREAGRVLSEVLAGAEIPAILVTHDFAGGRAVR